MATAVEASRPGTAGTSEDPYLATLPPGTRPFADFEREFTLGNISTEKLHPVTMQLSQTMHRSTVEGMKLLSQVDESVIDGLARFLPSIQTHAFRIAEKMRSEGGRVFLVGSGSSGRVAVDIAANCRALFLPVQIYGGVAGGDSAMLRAKEGFEDSAKEGKLALPDLRPGDMVFLLSASGSSSFNVGCGDFAVEKGAEVFYFYNSAEIPERTKKLLDCKGVISLCVDIGPQAIAGSTRLQAATLAEACLGGLLGSVCYLFAGRADLAERYPTQLLENMKRVNIQIKGHLKEAAQFAEIEKDVFQDPRSNFRKLTDVTNWGYVTFLADKGSVRECVIDAVETSPTFSTNPVRRKGEGGKKRAEFCAYVVGKENNDEAWRSLLGREVNHADRGDTDSFLLSCSADGADSFAIRSTGKGNLVIGVQKIDASSPLSEDLLQELEGVKRKGGAIGLIILCRGKLDEEQRRKIEKLGGAVLLLEDMPHDPFGFTETMALKQILNLISNASMVLMNKVQGNRMIDVRAANDKLVDRCMRLIKEVWCECKGEFPLSREHLYHYVRHVNAIKEARKEEYTPSVVKILLAMLVLKKTPADFQEIIDLLRKENEAIPWLV